MLNFTIARKTMAVLIGVTLGVMTSPSYAETPLPDWVDRGIDVNRPRLTGASNSPEAPANLGDFLDQPYWVFQSGAFATVEEAEAEALRRAAHQLQILTIHTTEKHSGWFDLLNAGYTWNLPSQLVKNYAVSQKFVEERQHSLGSVSATMYNVYLQVPNDRERLGVLMEHRRQTISRERTWALGMGMGVITWECFCIALGLRLYQWTKESWRGKILAASIIGGTLPLLLVIA